MKDRPQQGEAGVGRLNNHLVAYSYILMRSVVGDYTAVHIYYVIVLVAKRSLL